MTPEEIIDLETQRAHAKAKCAELYLGIRKLDELRAKLVTSHTNYKAKYETIDRQLAKVVKVPGYKHDVEKQREKAAKAASKPSAIDITYQFLAKGNVDELIKALQKEMEK